MRGLLDGDEDRESRSRSGGALLQARFAGLILDLAASTLARESGESIQLTRGELALLRLFVSRPGRVLSRDTVLNAVSNRPLEPFDRSVDMLVGRLRRKIEPDPTEPRLIVTVSGEGYRFDGLKCAASSAIPADESVGAHPSGVADAPLGMLADETTDTPERVAGFAKFGLFNGATELINGRVRLAFGGLVSGRHGGAFQPGPVALKRVPVPAPTAISPGKTRSILVPLVLIAACVCVIVAASVWRLVASRHAPLDAAHLSIVVLPFASLSDGPDRDYFADGITEDLTTDLSQIHGSFVISANTALTYRGKSVSSKEVGQELGIRYIVEGAVQQERNRVRVNARLIDAETDANLWAERFEVDITELFQLENQIVARLGNTLGFELIRAEADKSARSASIDAVDLTMRGWAMLWQAVRQQQIKEKRSSYGSARALFEQALARDPNYPDALAGAAQSYTAEFAFGWKTAETDYEAKILGLADRAISLAPRDARAYGAKSVFLRITHRAAEALRVADQGLAINSNSAQLYGARASAKNMLGRFEEAKSDARQAIRLSPRDPQLGLRHATVGDAELGLGHLDAALDEYHKAIEFGYHTRVPDLAAAYALQGKMDEARSALSEALQADPTLTVKSIQDRFPIPQAVIEGLRKAGLPEQ
jgi:adenylate cyclase